MRHVTGEGEDPRASGFGASNSFRLFLPLVSREWKNGSNSSYNCTPFLHSLLTKGKFWEVWGPFGFGFGA